MEHLKALCEVLDIRLSELVGESDFAKDAKERLVLEAFREASPEQQELALALLNLKRKG